MKTLKFNKKRIFFLIVVVLIIILIYFGYAYGRKAFPFGPEKWQAVQLQNGNVYYGHLKTFPCYKLTDVYFIQNIQNETSTISQLQPLNSLFFGPENIMYFQKNQILWWANLSSDSIILNIIKERQVVL